MNNSRLSDFFDMFTKLATAIFLFSSLYILCFVGIEGAVSLKYVWGVLGISAVLSLAKIIIFPDRELPKATFLVCNIVYALFCNIVVLAVGLWLNWFSLNHPATIIGIEITFVVVFIVVWIAIYLSTKHSADQMNEQLKKLKE